MKALESDYVLTGASTQGRKGYKYMLILPLYSRSRVPRRTPLITLLSTVCAMGLASTASAQEFGIDSNGVLFHVDENWSASFNYLCVNNDCRTGTRSGGRFTRDVSGFVSVGQTVTIEFKVQDNSIGQCLTGGISITRQANGSSVDSPCATSSAPNPNPDPAPNPNPDPAPNPNPDPAPNPNPDPAPNPSPDPDPAPAPPPSPPGGSNNNGAGLISVSGDTITTRFGERFRDRHESDRNHDTYINEYAQGSAYEIVLIDRPNGLEVQLRSPQTRLSMVNFTHDHIVTSGTADPPQYRGGGFMAKGSLSGPRDDNAGNMVNNLYFSMTSANGKSWSAVRSNREIVTMEFTPRRRLNGNFPQYYSDIIRYRAGQGGITFERNDDRYFSGGPTTNFAHGSASFEFSQAFLGIDQPLMNTFTLGRELFRVSFAGGSLPGNGGTATGADPNAAEDACINCHFQLGKGAPPNRGNGEQQGFSGSGRNLRVAPQLIGLGLLEAVDQSTINGFASSNGGKVGDGRFGWKATQATIEDQVRTAFARDMGVTSPSGQFVARIRDYIRALGVPIRRHPTAQANQQPNTALRVADSQTITDNNVLAGERAFNNAGCDNCHIPEMQTGSSHPIVQFRNITIRPFTDMLLWDMGSELCADSGEGNATACEWRTAPLWGTRLQERVTGHATFLHDGRATTRDAAIRAHGGSAQRARDAYLGLSSSERDNLILYLRTL